METLNKPINLNELNINENLLHTNFLKMVREYPNHPALIIHGKEWSYSDIAKTAGSWASVIRRQINQPQRIGILAYRSETSYIGVLTSLFLGATFVPLNPTFPTERTVRMIENADLDAILVGEESLNELYDVAEELKINIPVLFSPFSEVDLKSTTFNKIIETPYVEEEELYINPDVSKDSIAYLLFTSGSTGEPKGVPITHKNVVSFLRVNQQKYSITPEDRLSQTFELTFDLAIFDLFMAWSNGACVCAMKPIELLSPINYMEKYKITVWFSVPSIINLLRKQRILKKGIFPSLRLSLFCGEPLHKNSLESWQEAAPNSIIENLYGPTELTIACTSYRWIASKSEVNCLNQIVPIGKVYPGLKWMIIDQSNKPVPNGGTGELCIAGAQTFPGYWKNEELTREKMVLLNSADGKTDYYYRTGDEVQVLPTGDIAYIGRIDHQVKVNGHRVECGEVEGVLLEVPTIYSAKVLPWPISEGTAEGLVAFIVGKDINEGDIMNQLAEKLPNYMVPNRTIALDSLPLNSNGKIDRKKLYQLLEDRK